MIRATDHFSSSPTDPFLGTFTDYSRCSVARDTKVSLVDSKILTTEIENLIGNV